MSPFDRQQLIRAAALGRLGNRQLEDLICALRDSLESTTISLRAALEGIDEDLLFSDVRKAIEQVETDWLV